MKILFLFSNVMELPEENSSFGCSFATPSRWFSTHFQKFVLSDTLKISFVSIGIWIFNYLHLLPLIGHLQDHSRCLKYTFTEHCSVANNNFNWNFFLLDKCLHIWIRLEPISPPGIHRYWNHSMWREIACENTFNI